MLNGNCGLRRAISIARFGRIIFAGAWARKIHGPADFVRLIIVDNRLWLPLAGLMLSRGMSFLLHVVRPERLQRIEQALLRRPVRLVARAGAGSVGGEIAALYARVVIMQVTIILGAFLSTLLGTMAPLVILILLKTAADAVVHLAIDVREQSPAGAATPVAAR